MTIWCPEAAHTIITMPTDFCKIDWGLHCLTISNWILTYSNTKWLEAKHLEIAVECYKCHNELGLAESYTDQQSQLVIRFVFLLDSRSWNETGNLSSVRQHWPQYVQSNSSYFPSQRNGGLYFPLILYARPVMKWEDTLFLIWLHCVVHLSEGLVGLQPCLAATGKSSSNPQ